MAVTFYLFLFSAWIFESLQILSKSLENLHKWLKQSSSMKKPSLNCPGYILVVLETLQDFISIAFRGHLCGIFVHLGTHLYDQNDLKLCTDLDIGLLSLSLLQDVNIVVATCAFLAVYIRELKQATFLSTRTSTGSKPRRYRWRMMSSAVLVWNHERESWMTAVADFKRERLTPSLAIYNGAIYFRLTPVLTKTSPA